jgi:hypothetical protein
MKPEVEAEQMMIERGCKEQARAPDEFAATNGAGLPVGSERKKTNQRSQTGDDLFRVFIIVIVAGGALAVGKKTVTTPVNTSPRIK